MGMGEPLYNLDHVADADRHRSPMVTVIAISRRRTDYGIDCRAWCRKFPELGERTGTMLAISLHAVRMMTLRNEIGAAESKI